MKVGIAMPWRPKPGREMAHDYVCWWFGQVLPEATIYEVDTHHEDYNLAAARNQGMRVAEADGCDVVVITDADCVSVPPEHLHRCIERSASDGKVHMPFRNQRYLTEEETVALVHDQVLPPLEGGQGNGCCYVTTPATYWAFGGSDERFSGWGGDDDQLVAAATCLVGLVRHPGVVLSLWHPAVRDVGSERHRPNSLLAQRYWRAISNKEAMRSLIAERDY